MPAPSGPRRARRTSRRSSTCPTGSSRRSGAEALAELRPEDEPGLVLARRVFGDGRTRAYAWGRAIAREDLAAASERLIAMSGQFEQRRLAAPGLPARRPGCVRRGGAGRAASRARAAWRALTAARRHHEEMARDAGAAAARIEALRDLVERTDGLQAGEEETLRAERERMRHAADLAEGAARATAAVAPEDGDGAASLPAAAERALEPLTRLAPELEGAAAELRELTVRLSEVGSDLHRFVASLEADPGAPGGGRGAARPDRRAAPPLRRADAGGAARAPRERRGRSRRARRRPRPARSRRGRARARRAGVRGRDRRAPHGPDRLRQSRSPVRLPRIWRAWAWGRASSASS